MIEELAVPENNLDLNKKNVHIVKYKEKELYLIATAHVSKDSIDLVKEVVNNVSPNSICIELDEARYNNIKNPKKWEETDLVGIIKSKRVGFMLAQLMLSGFQKKIAQNLDTQVGGEMIAGIACAEETGSHLVLADRDIQTTFMRIWRKISFFRKIKLVVSLLFSLGKDEVNISEDEIEKLMHEDMLDSAMAELKKDYPEIGEILINERDQYLAYNIKNAPGEKVVAILGAAHVSGVIKEIEKDQDLEALNFVPAKKKIGKVIAWIIPAIIIALIVYAFAINIQTGLQQLTIWFIWNSGLAAIGTLLALGHPLSILVSFVAAPFTSVNPLLACGWFAGLVEAHVRKPQVKDLNNLSEDMLHFKGFYKNRFLKTLLVVVFSNLGSTAGTIIAGLGIANNLF